MERAVGPRFHFMFDSAGIAKQLRQRGTSGTAIFPSSGKSYADLSPCPTLSHLLSMYYVTMARKEACK